MVHWNVSFKLNQFRDSLDCIVFYQGDLNAFLKIVLIDFQQPQRQSRVTSRIIAEREN